MAKRCKKSRAQPTTKLDKCPSPISKLPDDVLCKIFHLLRLSHPIFRVNFLFSFWEYQKKALNWVAISWVCRHWRAVALNDSTLWADPPLHFPRWTMEMLHRSNDKGLSINLGCTSNDDILAALFERRLRIAHLTMSDEKLKTLLSKFTLSSAPMLEKLCIKKASGRMDETAFNYQLPGAIFVDAIRLQHLELAGVDIDWNSHLLPTSSLRALHLNQISLTSRPDMENLRTILGRMSLLRILRLHQALPVKHDNDTSSRSRNAPILLDSLQSLSIGDKPLEVASFFNNFALSGHTRNVDVIVSLEDGVNRDFDGLLVSARRREALGHFCLNAQSLAIDGEISGTQSGGEWQRFNLEINATEVSAGSLTAETFDDDLPGLDLKIRSKIPTSTSTTPVPFRCVFTDIFNSFEWLNVRELTLVSLDVKSYSGFGRVLAATLGALPTIHAIAIGPKCIDHLLSALHHSPANTQLSAAIAFSGLTEITMVDVPLQSRLTSIVGMLLSRHRRGVPIHKIGFDDCRGRTNKFMGLLREIVDEVEWDGVKL